MEDLAMAALDGGDASHSDGNRWTALMGTAGHVAAGERLEAARRGKRA